MSEMEYSATMPDVRRALGEHRFEVIRVLADLLAYLGARKDWTMEDNFRTTETLAQLASDIGLPSVGDRSDEAIAFWQPVAESRGLYDPEDVPIGGPI